MVRAQMKLVGMALGLGSAGKYGSRRSSLIRMKRSERLPNSAFNSGPNSEGHRTVARMISAATGLRSFATALIPSRVASKGMLPPQRLDQPRCNRRENSQSGGHPLFVSLAWNVTKRPGIAVCLPLKSFTPPPRCVDSVPGSHRVPVNAKHMHKLLTVGIGRQQRSEHCGTRRHQRPSRPPDVEVRFGAGKGRH